MRALTEQLYVDETEAADEGLADLLDENAFQQAPKPGTSLRLPTANPAGGTTGPSPAMRFSLSSIHSEVISFAFFSVDR